MSGPSSFRFFSPSSSSLSNPTPAAPTVGVPTAVPPLPVTSPEEAQGQYPTRSNTAKKQTKPPLTHHKSLDNVMFGRVGGREYANITPVPPINQTPQSPNAAYETVFEIATKRMATLDYLKRAHEGRVYWFNTVLFTKNDLNRSIYHDTKKIAKRATNYFILGTSIPNILDLGISSPLDYLRAFNQLLTEYDTYQSQNHEHHHGSAHSHSNGASVGGLRLTSSSVRIPKLFSRSKPRRGSSATNAPSLVTSSSMSGLSGMTTSPQDVSYQSSQDLLLERTRSLSGSTLAGSTTNLPSISQQSLSSDSSDPPPVPPLPSNPQYGMSISNPLPIYSTSSTSSASFGTPGAANGESEYMYLTIPPLPFDPDFYETFATLCDVLIDAYSRVLMLVSNPQQCGAGVGEIFLKADAKVRKCVVSTVVREFEEASRGVMGGVKGEINSIGKLVLGGIV